MAYLKSYRSTDSGKEMVRRMAKNRYHATDEAGVARRERLKARKAKYLKENREKISEWHKEHSRQLKASAIAIYGGCCSVCQESNIDLLVLDHVNDDGSSYRDKSGVRLCSKRVHQWAKKHGWPAVFQVLCHNHNAKKEAIRRSPPSESKVALRKEMFAVYGDRCCQCGETDRDVLQLDHVNGGGTEHRRKVGNSVSWAKKHGWPSAFRVLCANCNMLNSIEIMRLPRVPTV